MTVPAVLLIDDDGELGAIQAILERLQVDWVLADGKGRALERPRDLMISSGPRTMEMPPLSGEQTPLWICLYDRDFLPLREALEGIGVHYLVSADLAPRALELFLRQLLHGGGERRRVRRIPMECEVRIDVGAERGKASLLELSTEGCVLATDAEIPAERRVVVWLPAETLTGNEELEVPGRILRTTRSAGNGGEPGHVHVFRFGALDAETMGGVQRMLLGETLAAEVTPLRREPERADRKRPASGTAAAPAALELAQAPGERSTRTGERREAVRRPYTGCVEAIRWQGAESPEIAIACDLSTAGVLLNTSSQPSLGSLVTLALYGGPREEPVVVQARVARIEGEDVGMRFEALDPTQRRDLAALVEGTPKVERLARDGGALCVAELLLV